MVALVIIVIKVLEGLCSSPSSYGSAGNSARGGIGINGNKGSYWIGGICVVVQVDMVVLGNSYW